MEPETREYLDAGWSCRDFTGSYPPSITISGSDGDPIVSCQWYNAAHFLTPEAVAEYLIEQHGAAKRLVARERDIERAMECIKRAEAFWSDAMAKTCLRAARQALEPLPEAPDEKG